LIKRILILLTLIFIMLSLAGCWGTTEIDEAAYPIVLGIDAGPGRNLILSMAIANVTASNSGTEEKLLTGVRTRVFSTTAPGLFAGLNIINSILERQINASHLKMIVFSEAFARRDIEDICDGLTRWPQFRRTIYIAVAQGDAKRVIDAIMTPNEDNPAKFLELMMLTQGYIGYTPRGQFLKFYNALKTKGEEPIAILIAPRINRFQVNPNQIPELPSGAPSNANIKDPGNFTAGNPPLTGDGPIQLMGTAVFHRGQMVDKLTGNETIAMSILRGEFNRTFVTAPDPKVPEQIIQVNLKQSKKPKITIEHHGGNYIAKVQVNLNADIAEISADKSYELPKYLPLLEQVVQRWVRHQCLLVFNKAQKDGSDIFGFGKHARWLVADWPAWQKLDWNSAFQKMDLRLKVNVHVNQTGLIYNKTVVKEGK